MAASITHGITTRLGLPPLADILYGCLKQGPSAAGFKTKHTGCEVYLNFIAGLKILSPPLNQRSVKYRFKSLPQARLKGMPTYLMHAIGQQRVFFISTCIPRKNDLRESTYLPTKTQCWTGTIHHHPETSGNFRRTFHLSRDAKPQEKWNKPDKKEVAAPWYWWYRQRLKMNFMLPNILPSSSIGAYPKTRVEVRSIPLQTCHLVFRCRVRIGLKMPWDGSSGRVSGGRWMLLKRKWHLVVRPVCL